MQNKILYETKFLQLKSTVSPSGNEWYYVKRTNDSNEKDSAVVITTLIKKKDEYNFLLLKTKRPPIYAEDKAEFCLESPAGLIGDIDCNETLIKCAKKELLEETGHAADNVYVELLNSSTSAGLSSETISYVTAIIDEDRILKDPISDGGIIEARTYIPASKIRQFLIETSKELSVATATVCGIFFALNRIK